MPLLLRILKFVLFSALLVYQPRLTALLIDFGISSTIIGAVLNFVLFVLGAHLSIISLAFIYRRRKKITRGNSDNVTIGLNNVFYLLVVGAFIITVLAIFGIDHIALFTSLSIVAAAIAIVTKDYLNEIISGIIITFSREVSIGDYVKIGEQKGKIIDLNLTKVSLLNNDDNIIFLPNHKVFTSDIINYTKKQIKKVSVPFEIDIKFLTTIEDLEANLILSISDYHEFIVKDSFNLKIEEISKDTLLLKFQYTMHEVNRDREREIRKKTVRRLVNYVKFRKEHNGQSSDVTP